MNSLHPSTAWPPMLAAWFLRHSLYFTTFSFFATAPLEFEGFIGWREGFFGVKDFFGRLEELWMEEEKEEVGMEKEKGGVELKRVKSLWWGWFLYVEVGRGWGDLLCQNFHLYMYFLYNKILSWLLLNSFFYQFFLSFFDVRTSGIKRR